MTIVAPRHEMLLEELRRLAEEAAARVGVELVEVSLRGSSRRRHLRVDVDRAGAVGATIDDCQAVSLALGEALDLSELLKGSYVLEVSSPGLDRPIRTADDFRRNTGRRVVVSTIAPLHERCEFRGVLRGLADGHVDLQDDALGEVRIPMANAAAVRQEITFGAHGSRK